MHAIDFTTALEVPIEEKLSRQERAAKQSLNMGVELEFASDMTPTEVAKHLNAAMGQKSAFGGFFRFVPEEGYTDTAGKKRQWIVGMDPTAAKQVGSQAGLDKEKIKDVSMRLAQEYGMYLDQMGLIPDELSPEDKKSHFQQFTFSDRMPYDIFPDKVKKAGDIYAKNGTKMQYSESRNPERPAFWGSMIKMGWIEKHQDFVQEGDDRGKHGIEIGGPRISLNDQNTGKVSRALNTMVSTVDGIAHGEAGLHVHVGIPKIMDSIHQLRLTQAASRLDQSGKSAELAGRGFNDFAESFDSFHRSVRRIIVDLIKDTIKARSKTATQDQRDGHEDHNVYYSLERLREVATTHRDKYKSTNIGAAASIGTVEFRLGSSELAKNPEKLENWLRAIQTIFQWALSGDSLDVELDGGKKATMWLDDQGHMKISVDGKPLIDTSNNRYYRQRLTKMRMGNDWGDAHGASPMGTEQGGEAIGRSLVWQTPDKAIRGGTRDQKDNADAKRSGQMVKPLAAAMRSAWQKSYIPGLKRLQGEERQAAYQQIKPLVDFINGTGDKAAAIQAAKWANQHLGGPSIRQIRASIPAAKKRIAFESVLG